MGLPDAAHEVLLKDKLQAALVLGQGRAVNSGDLGMREGRTSGASKGSSSGRGGLSSRGTFTATGLPTAARGPGW
jgi:hypothetical protein